MTWKFSAEIFAILVTSFLEDNRICHRNNRYCIFKQDGSVWEKLYNNGNNKRLFKGNGG